VRDECGSLAKRLPKKLLFEVWQGGVSQTEGTLTARV
jgi:hypothetical protein